MFQFTRFPLPALCVQAGVPVHDDWWVSPFGHPRIKGRSAPPRGLSQPPTSFFGSHCQGIHRWPFVAWKSSTKDARARYEILKDRLEPSPKTGPMRNSPTEVGLVSDAHMERSLTTEERTTDPLDECINWDSCHVRGRSP